MEANGKAVRQQWEQPAIDSHEHTRVVLARQSARGRRVRLTSLSARRARLVVETFVIREDTLLGEQIDHESSHPGLPEVQHTGFPAPPEL